MSWFCNTPEAKAQLKKCYDSNCPGCEKCIWIEESANAMVEYHEAMQEQEYIIGRAEKEEPIVWDKSIKRWTKGGKLHGESN